MPKLWDSVRVGITQSPPESNKFCAEYPRFKPNVACVFPGWCHEMISFMAASAGLGIESVIIPHSDPIFFDWGTSQENGTYSGDLALVQNGTVDFLCLFFQSSKMDRLNHFHQTTLLHMSQFVFIASYRREQRVSMLRTPYLAFSTEVWIGIAGAFLAHSLVLTLMEFSVGWFYARKRSLSNTSEIIGRSLWRTLQMQLGKAEYPQTYHLSSWIANGLNLLYSLLLSVVMAQLYTGQQVASLMTDASWQQFDNADQAIALIERGAARLVTSNLSLFHRELHESNEPTMVRLRAATKDNPIRYVNNLDELFSLLATGSFITATQLDMSITAMSRNYCNLFYVTEGLPRLSSHLLFSLNATAKFKAIDTQLRHHDDFLRFLYEKYVTAFARPFGPAVKKCHEDKRQTQAYDSLKVEGLQGMFAVLVLGYACSLIFMIVEKCISMYERCVTIKDE